MTLTAPLPILDLAGQIRAGRPVTATARVHDTLIDARAAVREAIRRTLQSLDIDPDTGVIGYQLERDRHGWLLVGTWRAL